MSSLDKYNLYELFQRAIKASDSGENIWYQAPHKYLASTLALHGYTPKDRDKLLKILTDMIDERVKQERLDTLEMLDRAIFFQQNNPDLPTRE